MRNGNADDCTILLDGSEEILDDIGCERDILKTLKLSNFSKETIIQIEGEKVIEYPTRTSFAKGLKTIEKLHQRKFVEKRLEP